MSICFLIFWSSHLLFLYIVFQLDSLGSFNRRRATLWILLNKAIIYLFICLFIHGLIIIYVKYIITYPISNTRRKNLISKPWINKIDL